MSLLATRYRPYWGSWHTDQGSMWPSLDTWEHRYHDHYSSLSRGCHHHDLIMIVSLAAEVPGVPVLPLTPPLINVVVNINSTKVTCHWHFYRGLKSEIWHENEYPKSIEMLLSAHKSHTRQVLVDCFLLCCLLLIVVCYLWVNKTNESAKSWCSQMALDFQSL